MADNPNQPREYDVVLGGQALSSSAVLGGLEGVKKRLMSSVEHQRIAALSQALKYGEAGFNLVIQALQDESWEVKWAALHLLQQRAEPQVKQALQDYILAEDFCQIFLMDDSMSGWLDE